MIALLFRYSRILIIEIDLLLPLQEMSRAITIIFIIVSFAILIKYVY